MDDPFAILGVDPSSSESAIRAAWRYKAKNNHPDVGGTDEKMRILNAALQDALACLQTNSPTASSSTVATTHDSRTNTGETTAVVSRHVQHDLSCFTIDVLPVDGFEFVRLAAAMLGSITDEECPYMIEFTLENLGLSDPHSGWCRCELVPEAGGTMVHLTVGSASGSLAVEPIRDSIIDCINRLN